MNIGFALGFGAVSAFIGKAIQEELSDSKMGCGCRKAMDNTMEDDEASMGCPCHMNPEDEDVLLGYQLGTDTSIFPGSWNCQQTQDGQKVCHGGPNCGTNKMFDGVSTDYDTVISSLECPKCPPINVSGLAENQNIGGILVPVPPSCPSALGNVGGLGPVVPLAAAGLVAYLLLA